MKSCLVFMDLDRVTCSRRVPGDNAHAKKCVLASSNRHTAPHAQRRHTVPHAQRRHTAPHAQSDDANSLMNSIPTLNYLLYTVHLLKNSYPSRRGFFGNFTLHSIAWASIKDISINADFFWNKKPRWSRPYCIWKGLDIASGKI